jgi:hypothetical protein
MRIRLLTGRATNDGREAWSPGDELELPDDEARKLIEQGSAEPVAMKGSDRRETRPSATAPETR